MPFFEPSCPTGRSARAEIWAARRAATDCRFPISDCGLLREIYNHMRILGIDPGLERIGYGLIERSGSRLIPLKYGLIETPRIPLADRLLLLDEQIRAVFEELAPDELATEKLLFSVNRKTALDVAKAQGVILLAGGRMGLVWTEYTPPEIKQAVVGTGAADKRQVLFMVTKLLGLQVAPKPDDVSDALAIAICHAFKSRVAMPR